MVRSAPCALLLSLLCGCSSMLPRTEQTTANAWASYQAAQEAFDRIVPGETTTADLRALSLDPAANANIAILNYSDVLRRFMVNQSVSLSDLDRGVQECVSAKTQCRGYEVEQKLMTRHRQGNFWLDVLGFHRETRIAGWRFNGLVLLKGNLVVYKLTGGQPTIEEHQDAHTPLGPVQSLAGHFLGWSPEE
jgi:hypothetical protein